MAAEVVSQAQISALNGAEARMASSAMAGSARPQPEQMKVGFPYRVLLGQFESGQKIAAAAARAQHPKLADVLKSQLGSAAVAKTSLHYRCRIPCRAVQQVQLGVQYKTLHFERVLTLFAGIGACMHCRLSLTLKRPSYAKTPG